MAERILSRLTGLPLTTINNLFIRNLGIDTHESVMYFHELAQQLNPIAIDDKGAVSLSRKNRVGSAEALGAYGVMFRSMENNNIYKRIRITGYGSAKNVFSEVYIAVVLSLDPIVGHGICVPDAIFRGADVKAVKTRAIPGSLGDYTLYISMGIIPYNYETWNTQRPPDRSVLQHYLPIIHQLAEILATLERNYRFCHNDLHAENFLITRNGQVRLIDFGKSSIILDGVVYGSANNHLNIREFEFSCDMLTLLVDLYMSLHDNELRQFIRSLFVLPDRTSLLDRIIEFASENGLRRPSLACYSYTVWGYAPRDGISWTDEMREMLRQTPNCCRPASVAAICADAIALAEPSCWSRLGKWLCGRRNKTNGGRRRSRKNKTQRKSRCDLSHM